MKINILTAVLIALLTITLIPSINAAAEESSTGGFTYSIINNEAEITGFTGEPTAIEIPDTLEYCAVTKIRDNSFYNCTSLRQITLPDGIREIGHHCFYGCSALESIVIPDSVTIAGMGCFCGCSALKAVRLSSGMTELPESFLRACTSLISVNIPENVKNIGDFCFSGDTALEYVSLGNGLIEIGDCTFYMCDSLKGLYIPPTVERLGVCSAGYISDKTGAVINEEFVLIGAKRSAAHTYAKENNIRFVSADNTVRAMAVQEISRGMSFTGFPFYLLTGGLALLVVAVLIRIIKSFTLSNKMNKIN